MSENPFSEPEDAEVVDAELLDEESPSTELVPAADTAPNLSVRIGEVEAELHALTADAQALTQGMGTPGTDLVSTRSTDPVVAKQQLAAVRAQAQKTHALIMSKREELERLMREQLEMARAAMGPLEKFMAELQQGIETVNLYLGVDEDIVLLRDGASAPPDTPIALRQLLLYMDEECAVAAEEGGITPQSIEAFDRWLLEDPAHLDQVLPETKGIVALRPRRKAHRENWSSKDAEANKKTYWLVRNGQRVYRTLTQLETGDRVLPYADEFQRIFTRLKSGRRVPLTPGSFEWERAEEQAGAVERTYLRVGLILEGLLHRTPIFHPLPESGVSFLDPYDVKAGKVRYISDAEGLLGTGAESFEDWRRRLAEELRVGMRIVLGPGLAQFSERRSGGNSRLHPEGAQMPGDGEVFTIEERKGSRLIFRYREGVRWVNDGGWRGGEYREPKRRASCWVSPSDSFVLPFDLASVEEMERFLTTRSDRHNYVEMWPILKAAIAAKRRETELEAPFLVMLAGVLARENDVSVADAQDVVPELVGWWKLKNRYHRPLVAAAHQDAVVDANAAGEDHEAKAVRMIVAEHKRRLADARRNAKPELVERLRAEHPHALLIARPRRGGYLVLDPAEGEKNVYVHESHYSAKGELKERKEWTLPGVTRPKSWLVLHQSERWERWELAADAAEHLRGPEREQLIESALRALSARGRLVALAYDRDRELHGWVWSEDGKWDESALISGTFTYPEIKSYRGGWARERGQITLTGLRHGSEEKLRHDDGLPWERREWRSSWDESAPDEPRPPQHQVIWRDATLIDQLVAHRREFRVAYRQREALEARTGALVASVRAEWERRAWAVERARFDEDFGDPSLWEAHKKSKERDLRFPHDLRRYSGSLAKPTQLFDAVALLVERGEDPDGRTVADVLAEVTTRFGAQQATLHPDLFDSKRQPYVYTAPKELHSYVMSAPLSELQPDDDDEDEFDADWD